MLRSENGAWLIASGELTVENTTYCGADCIMCPRHEFRFEWSHMPEKLFQDVMDQAVALGITSLDLCGFGDPFMDPGYEAKLRYVRSNYPEVKIYTATTGHLLTEKRLPWVCELFDTIKISNYGFSQESYKAVHKGVLDYQKVWENLNRLVEAPREGRPYVIMSFLIFPENKHEVEAWRAYWEPRADEVMVWQPHNYGGAQSIENLSFRTRSRELAEVRSCGRPVKGNPFVRVNGDVSVCCFDFNNNLVVGNLNDQSLFEVLNGNKLAAVKKVHEIKEFRGSGLICENCDQIYDRKDALVYSNNPSRKTDQPTTHPDHVVRLVKD